MGVPGLPVLRIVAPLLCGQFGNVYDFENHLVQHGAITIVYDGDGNRVAKTAGGSMCPIAAYSVPVCRCDD